MSKKDNKIKGNFGENIACNFLEKKGYRILARNFNCVYGEIDIIALYNKEIIFIEVKSRTQNSYGTPIEAVDLNKKSHIYKASRYYLYKTNHLNEAVRFDVVEVYILSSESYKITHTQNVITDMPKKLKYKYT